MRSGTASGERIPTVAAESMVNRVIERRMTKNKPPRWSRRGAHLPVQIRLTLPAVVESISRPLTPYPGRANSNLEPARLLTQGSYRRVSVADGGK